MTEPKVGDKIKVMWHGKLITATIKKIESDGTITIE